MATLSLNVASDIANAILKDYTRGPALSQTMQEKPLLRFLNAGKKNFQGGNQYVSDPVKGAYMSDPGQSLGGLNAGAFFAGYSEDDALSFAQAANLLRAEYPWRECHAGLVITWTELKKDGITITEHNQKSDHAQGALFRLTSLFEDRMEDYGESWARSMNNMLWADGSQDSKQVDGVQSLLTLAPGAGTTGGLDRGTYSWWQTYAFLDIVPSEEQQTLTKTLREKQRILRKRGGKPDKFLCGSNFISALERELQAKGSYTVEGFTQQGKTDIGMAVIALKGVGVFEWDPTLDDMGLSNFCFEFDSRRIRLRPMQGEDNKVVAPERPYQYMVFLKSMTWTGALQATQLNCHAVFSIAQQNQS